MTPGVCPDCGWVSPASKPHKARSVAIHLDRKCGTEKSSNKGAAVIRGRAEAETRSRVTAAGYPTERSPAEWVAHPTALDDLLRVLCGTALTTIEGERRMDRERRRSA